MKNGILPFALLLFSFGWHYSDAQAQWTTQATGFTNVRGLWDISIVDENIVWGIAYDGLAGVDASVPEFTRTTDGGATWTAGTFPAGYGWSNISAINADTAWISAIHLPGSDGAIFKTTDGGVIWNEQGAGMIYNSTSYVNFVHFWNANEGIAGGDPNPGEFEIYTTTDGGTTWTPVPGTAIPNPQSGEFGIFRNYCVIGDNIWFSTNKLRVFHSTDKGLTWTVGSTGIAVGNPPHYIDIAFWNANEGIARRYNDATNSNVAVVRTSDGGASWTPVTVTGTFFGSLWGGIAYVPGTTSTLVSTSDKPNGGGSSYSTDGGITWTVIDSDVRHYVTRFLNRSTGWSAGYNTNSTSGGISKYTGSPLPNRLLVNDDATGANNGSSWTDAFTDLQSALAIAEEGDQIWVAEGLYKPDTAGGSQNSTFLIDKNLQLYGGFIGTEVSLAERGDPVEHPTILSGDLNENDIDDDFTLSRADNVLHVMTITTDVSTETIIDGFTIKSGHTDAGNNTGGGIYSEGAPIIKQCIFLQNFAKTDGGGLYFVGAACQGTEIVDCLIEKNKAGDFYGGGLFCWNVPADGIQISQSIFNANEAARGCGIASADANLKITGCTFSNHSNREQGGGLWFIAEVADNLSLEVDSCTFENNESSFGGGLYFTAFTDNCSFRLKNSTFSGNAVSPMGNGWDQGGGGAIMSAFTATKNTVFDISGCLFYQNSSSQNGGGLMTFLDGDNIQYNLSNTFFEENTATNNASGFYASLTGTQNQLEVDNCQFVENKATNFSSAADFWGNGGGTGTVLVDSCFFENNTSTYSGALEMGNGYNGGASVNYTLTNSTFINNQATEGGAAGFWSDNLSTANFTIENCVWDGNTGTSKGGAIQFNPSSNNYKATVNRCTLINNQSPNGEAINSYIFVPVGTFPANAKVSIENSLIANNSGGNAAISVDSLPNLELLNCTIADNSGGGIQLADQSGLTLQNTILYNPGSPEYTAATTDVTFTSHGGNLIRDTSLAGQLQPSDKQGLDPLLDAEYKPLEGSPCVDAGNDNGVTAALDLAGNPRIQGSHVDIGALESPFVVNSTRELIAGELALSPNPATDFLTIRFPESIASLDVQVFDTQGRLLKRQSIAEYQPLAVKDLPAGTYLLKAIAGDRLYTGRFIKL